MQVSSYPVAQGVLVFMCSGVQLFRCPGMGVFLLKVRVPRSASGHVSIHPQVCPCTKCVFRMFSVCFGGLRWKCALGALEVCFRQVRVPSMRLRSASQWCVSAECANGVSVFLLQCERCLPNVEGAPRVRLQCSQDLCYPSVCCPKCGVCVLPQPGVHCPSQVCVALGRVAGVPEVCLTSVLLL